MIGFLVTLLVTAVSLLIISKLPTGVEINSFNKALVSAVVFGILNAILRPILAFISAPLTFITFGFFTLIINAIIFGLAAFLVTGFRLRWGFWSALIGSFALGVINSIIFHILPFSIN
ncbi:MAG: phage holin family protein [Xenococcus sp. MO_188.B8]|nr:phage holin family protein [Xenococcus sp. MO_188.B8]